GFLLLRNYVISTLGFRQPGTRPRYPMSITLITPNRSTFKSSFVVNEGHQRPPTMRARMSPPPMTSTSNKQPFPNSLGAHRNRQSQADEDSLRQSCGKAVHGVRAARHKG